MSDIWHNKLISHIKEAEQMVNVNKQKLSLASFFTHLFFPELAVKQIHFHSSFSCMLPVYFDQMLYKRETLTHL